MKRLLPLLVAAVAATSSLQASTINVGAVALNTNTGYYLGMDQSFNTSGEILVGYFSKTEAELKTLIGGWADSAVITNANGTVTQYSAPTYSHYTDLLSSFTQIGTGGSYGSTVAGWSFSTNGTVAGTSSGVDTTVLPAGTQLYVWAFNISNFTTNYFDANTQWGLYTGETNWLAPSSGTKSLNLAQVVSSGVLIGTDLAALGASSPNYNSVSMVATVVPEPTTNGLLFVGAAAVTATICFRRRKQKGA